jgi:hypothetical protein
MLPADPAWTAALATEHMEPGPAQAGWLEVAATAAERLDEYALVGMTIAAQKLASRAQATGLAAAAQITARAAAADPKIGLAADGRPSRLCRDALGQISLALMLTDYSAATWADLAVSLAWRLPATGEALAAGVIDFERARVISEATSVLSEDAARKVEEEILPGARRLTLPELRERLHFAVIAADPEGAEQRRQAAERHADVRLYAEDDQTATLMASKLPQIESATGYARVNAMARARMAAGCSGNLGFNRSQVLLGLMLDTLPPIPPAEGAPPDQPPPGHPGDPGDDADPNDSNPGDGGRPDGGGPGDGSSAGGPDGVDDLPAPRDEDAPPDDGLDALADENEDDQSWDPAEEAYDPAWTGSAPEWPALGVIPPALARPARPADSHPAGPADNRPAGNRPAGNRPAGNRPAGNRPAGNRPAGNRPADGRPADGRPAGNRPAGNRPADGRPVPGLLDVTLPWVTLTGISARPGKLGRIGAITPIQARQLAQAAEADPAAQWRIIVTNAVGQAIAVARVRRRAAGHRTRKGLASVRNGLASARDGLGSARDGPPGTGLVGRVTLTISQDVLAASQQATGGPDPPSPVAAAALKAARRALDRALAQGEADRAAGGCAHADESAAYRPPPRLREFVIARDVTCRNPACRQPAWRADLDHTVAYDHDGRTCRCNLGGACRRDHQLKQHPRWKLEQTRPGEFTWITPAGRRYTIGPDIHPV